jgi:hypothetical protein
MRGECFHVDSNVHYFRSRNLALPQDSHSTRDSCTSSVNRSTATFMRLLQYGVTQSDAHVCPLHMRIVSVLLNGMRHVTQLWSFLVKKDKCECLTCVSDTTKVSRLHAIWSCSRQDETNGCKHSVNLVCSSSLRACNIYLSVLFPNIWNLPHLQRTEFGIQAMPPTCLLTAW